MRVLAEGLEELGILQDAPPRRRSKEEHQFYKRYSLHNVSHMLGLDVHDCAQARQEVYKFGKLKPGMVLTVEPGLYFQEDDLTVPAKYRGIGVRIEDDVRRHRERAIENLSRTSRARSTTSRRGWARSGSAQEEVPSMHAAVSSEGPLDVAGRAVVSKKGAQRLRAGHPWVYRGDVLAVPRGGPGIVEVATERGELLGRRCCRQPATSCCACSR